MNRKRILGITALLAVIALGLMFTACPDTDVREVIFINQLGCSVTITSKNAGSVELAETTLAAVKDPTGKLTKTGEDIVILTITFGNTEVDRDPTKYVMLGGNLVAGQNKKGKQAQGMALASGTLIFAPDPSMGTNANPAAPKKINVIQIEE